MENEQGKELEARRAEAVKELRTAFAELESGGGLTRLVGGHGIQSRVFEFERSEPALEILFPSSGRERLCGHRLEMRYG